MENDGPLLTIGELARRAGVPVRTIRFWSDSGLVPPASRTDGDRRLYDAACVARLELVTTLRELGVSLADVRRVLGGQVTAAVCAGGPLNLAIRPYLPVYIVSHSLSATTPLCLPGAASCWLSAWSGLGMLAVYAAIAMVLGALTLARRDA